MGIRGVQLGLDLRDEGMAQVLDRDPRWAGRAAGIFQRIFVRGEEMTGEDLRQQLTMAGLEKPAHRNAWGALTNALALRGLIKDTGRVIKANDPVSHARRLVIWRVLYEPDRPRAQLGRGAAAQLGRLAHGTRHAGHAHSRTAYRCLAARHQLPRSVAARVLRRVCVHHDHFRRCREAAPAAVEARQHDRHPRPGAAAPDRAAVAPPERLSNRAGTDSVDDDQRPFDGQRLPIETARRTRRRQCACTRSTRARCSP